MCDSEKINTTHENNLEFSIDFYTKVIEENPDNVVISPFFVQAAAALTYLGASDDTAKEMVQGLHFCSTDPADLTEAFRGVLKKYKNNSAISIANKYYICDRYNMDPNFSEIVSCEFQSEVENIDFLESAEAAAIVNMWVKEKTQNKIKDILEPDDLDEVTSSIILSAIYFKTNWEHPFSGGDSFADDFWFSETESIESIFMVNRTTYRYKEVKDGATGLTFEALELPFKGCNLSMIILLPQVPQDFENVEKKFFDIDLIKFRADLELQEVHVKIPRFEMEFGDELKNIFKKMGLKVMFTTEADFTKMLEEDDPLYVQKIYHKVFLEINESDAEAAPATGVQETYKSEDYPTFSANRPFIFLIVDDCTNVFFLGKLRKPKTDQDGEQE